MNVLAGLTYDQAVDRLLGGFTGKAVMAPPDWMSVPPARRTANMTDEEKMAFQRLQGANSRDLKGWWYGEMLNTTSPFTESMTLFWHNHFATTYTKVAGGVGPVQSTKMLALKAGELPGPQGQLELFRQYALGNFRDLLIEVARDPAMVVFLDGRTNVKRRTQEKFGGEMMERFTCGVGN